MHALHKFFSSEDHTYICECNASFDKYEVLSNKDAKIYRLRVFYYNITCLSFFFFFFCLIVRYLNSRQIRENYERLPYNNSVRKINIQETGKCVKCLKKKKKRTEASIYIFYEISESASPFSSIKFL